MKMKWLLLLLVFSVSQNFAQNLTDLKINAEKMYHASYVMDLNAVLDLTYPKIFEISSRESILEVMQDAFDNDLMTVRFVEPKVNFNYGPIINMDGQKFSVIRYDNTVRLTYKEDLDPETVKSMIAELKGTSKYKTVAFEKETNSFLLTGPATMIAVADNYSSNTWSFVDYDSDDIFQSLFDPHIKSVLSL